MSGYEKLFGYGLYYSLYDLPGHLKNTVEHVLSSDDRTELDFEQGSAEKLERMSDGLVIFIIILTFK